MLLLIAILLLVFVLSPAAGIVVVVLALVLELGEIAFWRKWMRNRRVQTGSEAMPGEIAEVVEPVTAEAGTVRIRGENWHARSRAPIGVGERVRIASVEGLTLSVEPAAGTEKAVAGTEKGP
jgi:membrane-bound serine protease (ClpP class)